MKQLSFSTSLSLSWLVLIAGCSEMALVPKDPQETGDVVVEQADGTQPRPQTRPNDSSFGETELTAAPEPAATARTAEQFDTTSQEDRQEAAAAPEPNGEKRLGETVASLGDVTQPGFWLETPLVSAPGKGRVEYPAAGGSAQVELIPIDGPATAGSRISLPAMRLLGAPLTELPTLVVYQTE